jgi:hypothetical protein
MAGFAQRQEDPASSVALATPVNGYDEVAAKKVEEELGELSGRLNETHNTIAWLEGALPEGVAHELLGRMKALGNEMQSDLHRLVPEAHKELRGE